MALAALGASMLGGVAPIDCLLRGAVAFAVGVLATQVWYVFFTIRTRSEAIGPEENGEPPAAPQEPTSASA